MGSRKAATEGRPYELNSPLVKGGKRGIMRYAPYALLYVISDRSNLLPHKNEVADPETEKRNGHNGNEMGDHNEDALR